MKSTKIIHVNTTSTNPKKVSTGNHSRPSSGSKTRVHGIMQNDSTSSSHSSLPDVEQTSKEAAEVKDTDGARLEEEQGEREPEEEQCEDEQEEGDGKTKKAVKKLTEEEVLAKAEEVVPSLLSCDDYSTIESVKGVSFLRKYAISSATNTNARRVRYFDKLAELGATSLFEKIWKTQFVDSFPDNVAEEAWKNMKDILLVMWNGTDRSTKLAQTVLDTKTHLYVIKWLRDPKLKPDSPFSKNAKVHYTIKGLFGIVHNTLANCDAGRCTEMLEWWMSSNLI